VYVGRARRSRAPSSRRHDARPNCRVGGEVEAAPKGAAHSIDDGFLGHAYVGEWVTSAPAAQQRPAQRLRPVRVTVNGRVLSSGQTKVGCFLGDHTKTGLGTLLTRAPTRACSATC